MKLAARALAASGSQVAGSDIPCLFPSPVLPFFFAARSGSVI